MYKVPEKQVIKRLETWKLLRRHLETSNTPFEDVVNFFNQFPKVKIYTDPYDQSTWPSPWELIEENQYCAFNLILAVAYTIQLSDRFKSLQPQITISIDSVNKTMYYLLFLDDKVYGFNDEWLDVNKLPKSLKNIKIYHLAPLN